MWTTRAFFILGHKKEKWNGNEEEEEVSFLWNRKFQEKNVSLCYIRLPGKEWTGGALLFNPSTDGPSSSWNRLIGGTPPPPLYHYHITPIDGWRAVHQPPEYLWIRIFILASCDRLIVYSPKKFQRPFFTKIYFSRGEIHFRLIHHSTKRKYHTADERFCIYWFIYFQKPILVWWFASGSGL
jgi:hypothetical protein